MTWLATLTTPLVLLLMMMTVVVEGQGDGNFWWLRGTTNAPPEPNATPGEQPPCECVKYYLCINGTISTSGAGIIDIRLGGHQQPPPQNRDASSVIQCPDLYDVCCAPPPPPTTLASTTTTTPRPTLPPDTPCECVSFVNCTGERIVSDGGGDTSLEAFGFLSSHSACPIPITVCCALEPSTTTSTTTASTTSSTSAPVVTSPAASRHPHCDCVARFQCDSSGTIITSGAGLLNLRTRVRNPNPGIQCEDPSHICCNIPSSDYEATTTTTPNVTTPVPTTDPIPTTPSCGSRNRLGIAARIIGFREGESQFGEFPWVAAVLQLQYIQDRKIHLFVGGGTLVRPGIVVTAAHKVMRIRPENVMVRLGEWDTQNEHEPLPFLDVNVKEVVIHPRFDPTTLYNDIALLILQEEVQETSHIKHICVADDVSNVDMNACVINGWGKDGFEETGEYQLIMKSLTLPIVDHRTCQTQLRTTRLGRYFRLHHSFVCAGGELGIDACTGDGGGPLACPRLDDPSRYLLVGITAWGIGCGQDGIPGVYASVPANYAWIRNETISRFPLPTTTTTVTTSTTTPTTTTVAEEYAQEEYDYERYTEWEEDKKNNRSAREKRRRQSERRERKRKEREERKRQRKERRQRQMQKQQNTENGDLLY